MSSREIPANRTKTLKEENNHCSTMEEKHHYKESPLKAVKRMKA